MLHDQKLAKFMWREVANALVYVQNRTAHKALDNNTLEEDFIGERPGVIHLRIFGCLVYFHVLKEKMNKLEASGKKESEPKNELTDNPMGSMDPLDPPPHDPPTRKRPLWLRDTLQDADQHATPRGTFRKCKKPSRYQGYIAVMSNIIQVEPFTFEEATKEQVWKDSMNEEYESIIQNDVWEVGPRPQGKYVATSKWLFKIKHGADGSIEKYKARFVARGLSQKEGIDYDEIFARASLYTTIRSVVALAAS
eukprot:PITA_02870